MTEPKPTIDLALLTRPGCHLCEAARADLADLAERYGLPWREIDADDDAELAARHGEEIPVLFIDGKQRDFWSIDVPRIATLLEGLGARPLAAPSRKTPTE